MSLELFIVYSSFIFKISLQGAILMLFFIQILNIILPIVYGISCFFYAQYFRSKNEKTAHTSFVFLTVGLFLHLVFMLIKGYHFQSFPIRNSFASLSMLALDIAIVYYIIERIKKESTTGIFFLSIVVFFQVVSSLFYQVSSDHDPLLSNPMFGVHIALALLGFSSLAISGLYGLMYLMLAKEIKKRHFGIIYDALPPLETLSDMGKYATICAIPLLGLGIFLGHCWHYKMRGVFFTLDPKIITTDVLWIIYVSTWLIIQRRKMSGMLISMFYFWGSIVFLFILGMVKFFSSTFHRFD